MDSVTPQERSGEAATQVDPANDPDRGDVQSLWRELRGLSHDYLQLAALATRRAGQSLVTMMVAGVTIAVFLNSAWLGLMAAAVMALIENGVRVSSAILLAVAANLMVTLILCRVIRCKSRYLQFPSILRSLKPRPVTRPGRISS